MCNFNRKELARLRAEHGLSLRDLAIATGITKSMISRLESGHRSPSIRVLRLLERALCVKKGSLLK